MRYRDKAWIAVAATVVAAEFGAKKGELLSEGVDDYLTRWPIATRLVVVYVAVHLLNLIPNDVDPLAIVAKTFGR